MSKEKLNSVDEAIKTGDTETIKKELSSLETASMSAAQATATTSLVMLLAAKTLDIEEVQSILGQSHDMLLPLGFDQEIISNSYDMMADQILDYKVQMGMIEVVDNEIVKKEDLN